MPHYPPKATAKLADTRGEPEFAVDATVTDSTDPDFTTLAGSGRENRRFGPGLLRSSRFRRYTGWSFALAALLLVSVPAVLWMHYQTVHVMSRNAIVRGHLAEIGTRLNGVLAGVDAVEGERVAAGQVLARLEDRHIRSEAQEAQAELDGLERELQVERLAIEHERRLSNNRRQEAVANLAAAEAEVAAAHSRADDAREYYKVRKQLVSQNAVSPEDVRAADTKRRTAQALLNVAKAHHAAALSAHQTVQLEADGIAIREQRIGVLEANVMRARAKLSGAKADLEGSLIRAPDDGAVIRWLVKPGGSVEVGKPVMSMWVGKDVWVEAWIDEDDISRVKVGSQATVTLQSFPGREFTGVVKTIGLTTDYEMPVSDVPQPRFVRMRGAPVVGVLVRLDDPPEALLPGLSAVVAIRDVAER